MKLCITARHAKKINEVGQFHLKITSEIPEQNMCSVGYEIVTFLFNITMIYSSRYKALFVINCSINQPFLL